MASCRPGSLTGENSTNSRKEFPIRIVGRATLKKLRRKSKTQFVKQECNTQNTIALLNYLKRIAPQQLVLRTQVFTKKEQRTQLRLFCKQDITILDIFLDSKDSNSGLQFAKLGTEPPHCTN
jgi:hypothetical protein